MLQVTMGIKDLVKVLGDHAAKCMIEKEIKTFFGRKVAIDASMSIYQFLIAVRQQDGGQMTNEAGEVTSHLLGLFYRTIRMIDNGIKPVYVFDGKPPEMKSGELEKRTERRETAQKAKEEAEEAGDMELVNKFDRRLVKVTRQHNEDCKQLLTCMGVPWINAPSEAEAQCASLVKHGLVYATGTEDMDALTFGSKVLLRHLTVAESRKLPIKVFDLDKILEELEMNHNEFVDLCILLGCDYCGTIRGIGPKKAVQLIKEYRSIDEVLKHIDKTKYPVPENWLYKEARNLFLKPDVLALKDIDLKWTDPDEEALVEYLVKGKGFADDRIRNGCKRLQKARSTTVQGRLDTFFKVLPSTTDNSSKKRKQEPSKQPSKKGRSTFKKR